MDSWTHDVFLDSRWVPGFTMGSWIHDGLLDSLWVPRFTMGSWCRAWHGSEIFGTAEIIRAQHRNICSKWIIRARPGNICHGTNPSDPDTARHGLPCIPFSRDTIPGKQRCIDSRKDQLICSSRVLRLCWPFAMTGFVQHA